MKPRDSLLGGSAPRGYPQVTNVSIAFGLFVVQYSSRSFFLKDEGGGIGDARTVKSS